MKVKDFCPYCMEINEIEFVEKNEIIEVRGKQIPVKYKERKCTKCGDFYSNVPKDDDPYDMAYRIYREKHNMTQPEDIKKLREKYDLTQAELGELLDWGAVTLSRYENGALQDGSHQNDLWALENPQFVLELINKRPNALPRKKIEKIKKQINGYSEELKDIYTKGKIIFEEGVDTSPAHWLLINLERSEYSISQNKKICEELAEVA